MVQVKQILILYTSKMWKKLRKNNYPEKLEMEMITVRTLQMVLLLFSGKER